MVAVEEHLIPPVFSEPAYVLSVPVPVRVDEHTYSTRNHLPVGSSSIGEGQEDATVLRHVQVAGRPGGVHDDLSTETIG
jgi:hypothetical protein